MSWTYQGSHQGSDTYNFVVSECPVPTYLDCTANKWNTSFDRAVKKFPRWREITKVIAHKPTNIFLHGGKGVGHTALLFGNHADIKDDLQCSSWLWMLYRSDWRQKENDEINDHTKHVAWKSAGPICMILRQYTTFTRYEANNRRNVRQGHSENEKNGSEISSTHHLRLRLRCA